MTTPVDGAGATAPTSHPIDEGTPGNAAPASSPSPSTTQNSGPLAQLADMPLEILREIVRHAPPRSVVSLARTNRKLNFQLAAEVLDAKRAVTHEQMMSMQKQMMSAQEQMAAIQLMQAEESIARQMREAIDNERNSAVHVVHDAILGRWRRTD